MGTAGALANIGGHFTREIEEITVDEEEPGKLMVLDQAELFGEATFGVRPMRRTRRIELLQLRVAELGQRSRGRAAEVGKSVPQILGEIERRATLGDHPGVGYRVRPVAEQSGDLGGRAQVKLAVGPPHGVGAVEGGAMPDGNQHVLQAMPPPFVVVHITGRDHGEAGEVSEVGQGVGERVIAAHGIPLELDEKPLLAERRAAAFGESPRGSETLVRQNVGQQPFAAPGKHDQPLVPPLQRGEIEPRVSSVFSAQVRLGDEAAEVGVPGGIFREQGDVRAIEQRQLGAGDRLEAELLGGLGESHRAVDAMMVGEPQGGITQSLGLEGEVLREGGAVQERECRMAMELDVHSDGLLEPLAGGQIFVQHDVLAFLENYFDVTPADGSPPPLVIYAPDLTDGFDGSEIRRIRGFGILPVFENGGREITAVQLDQDSPGPVQGSKSMSA